jgi:2-phospho-L-lactate transferase/gluconeogenesis factor (CofD/UPF0052 family)
VKRVVAFSGGRGSETFVKSWNKTKPFSLDLIINPYDDGLSTGRIRDFIPGYLGPSDFRKNLVHYLHSEPTLVSQNLAGVLECRVNSFEEAQKCVGDFAGINTDQKYRLLPAKLFDALTNFQEYELTRGSQFNYEDCALGNLVLAGLYIECDQNFQGSISELCNLVSAKIGLWTASNQNGVSLVAITDKNEFLAKEYLIVNGLYTGAVKKLGFLSHELLPGLSGFRSGVLNERELKEIKGNFMSPKPCSSAIEKLDEADIICYLPGTQNSSLFPSYKILGGGIQNSPAAAKVLVLNLTRDHDMANWKRSDILSNALVNMNDQSNEKRSITHVLLNDPSDDGFLLDGPIREMSQQYKIEIIAKNLVDTSSPARHSGSVIVETLLDML